MASAFITGAPVHTAGSALLVRPRKQLGAATVRCASGSPLSRPLSQNRSRLATPPFPAPTSGFVAPQSPEQRRFPDAGRVASVPVVHAAAAEGGEAAAEAPKTSELLKTLQLGSLFGLWYLFNIYFNIYNKQVSMSASLPHAAMPDQSIFWLAFSVPWLRDREMGRDQIVSNHFFSRPWRSECEGPVLTPRGGTPPLLVKLPILKFSCPWQFFNSRQSDFGSSLPGF